MAPNRTVSTNGGSPKRGASSNSVSLEKDILPHLATAARMLAIKGFSPDEAKTGDGSCGLTVRGKNAQIEGKIEFRQGGSGGEGIGWDYAITSSRMPDKQENGTVGDEKEVQHVVEAFVSVFTTVASFTAA
jgi:hypothetical protein